MQRFLSFGREPLSGFIADEKFDTTCRFWKCVIFPQVLDITIVTRTQKIYMRFLHRYPIYKDISILCFFFPYNSCLLLNVWWFVVIFILYRCLMCVRLISV